MELYNLSVDIIGTVPPGSEIIYLFGTFLLFIVILLWFVAPWMLVYKIFD